MRSASLSKPSCWLVAGLLFLGACESAPPVQEMSDARQAIEVAKEAGAESHARIQLDQALEFLAEAERELTAAEYARARRSAVQAKAKALEARALSEASQPH